MNKDEQTRRVRAVEALKPYPAVVQPAQGGFEVIFPNLAGVTAYGPDREVAQANAREALTAELGHDIAEGRTPPRPSDPDKLIAGEDEPAGAELVMIDPDKKTLRQRLGVAKRQRGQITGSLGRLGK